MDRLLSSPSDLTSALDPFSKLTAAAGAAQATAAAAATNNSEISGGPSRVNTQLRSRDTDGRLWVEFESAGAADQTLQAARVVDQLAEAAPTH